MSLFSFFNTQIYTIHAYKFKEDSKWVNFKAKSEYYRAEGHSLST